MVPDCQSVFRLVSYTWETGVNVVALQALMYAPITFACRHARTAGGALKIRAPKGADFMVDGSAGITVN